MSDNLFALLIGLTVGASVLLGFHSLNTLKADVPKEDREYMDPLPPLLNMAWPLILFIEYHLTCRFPPDWLEATHKRLQETGVGYLMSAEQFYAVRVFGAIATVLLGSVVLGAIDSLSPASLVLLGLAGFYFPIVWLRDVRTRRQKDVLRALPVYLDFITMAVEA